MPHQTTELQPIVENIELFAELKLLKRQAHDVAERAQALEDRIGTVMFEISGLADLPGPEAFALEDRIDQELAQRA